MARELVVLLGDPTSGLATIQSAMRGQIWKGGPSLSYPVKELQHGPLANNLGDNVREGRKKKVLTAQKQLLDEAQTDVVVISFENFEDTDAQSFKETVERYMPEYAEQMRLIAYVCPHVDRVVSSWAEARTLGIVNKPLAAFAHSTANTNRFRYFERFRSWQDAFGDRFELRPMIPSHLHGHCVVRDFLSYALKTDGFELLEEPAANETMGVEDLIIMSQMHKAFRNSKLQELVEAPEIVQVLGRNLAIEMAVNARENVTKVRAHRALVQRMQAFYAEDAGAMDAHFFANYAGAPMSEALEQAYEKADDTPFTMTPADYFSPVEWRDIEVWSQMICKMSLFAPRQWPQHFLSLHMGVEG